MYAAVARSIFEIFAMFALGGLARRLGYIRDEDLDRLSRFVVDLLFPLLVFHTILEDFEVDRIGELWGLPFVGFGIMALGAGAGFFLRRGVRSADPDLRKTFHHFCAVNNFGFLPMIIVQDFGGAKALALLFFLNLGSNIGYWTVGVTLLGKADLKTTLRNLFSPTLVTLLFSLFLAFTGLKAYVPGVFLNVCGSGGAAAIPIMLVLIGATLSAHLEARDKADLLYLTFVRLVLLPFLTILVLKQLPMPEDVFRVAAVVALMPAAVSSSILTMRYGGSPAFAAQAAVVTTLVSLITVPVALWILL